MSVSFVLTNISRTIKENWTSPPRTSSFTGDAENALCIEQQIHRNKESVNTHRYRDGTLFLAKPVKEIAIDCAKAGLLGMTTGIVTAFGHTAFSLKNIAILFFQKTKEERDGKLQGAKREFVYATHSVMSIFSSAKGIFHACTHPLLARKNLDQLDESLNPRDEEGRRSVLSKKEAKETIVELGSITTAGLFSYYFLPSILSSYPGLSKICAVAALTVPLVLSYRRYQTSNATFSNFAKSEAVGAWSQAAHVTSSYFNKWEKMKGFSVPTLLETTSLGHYEGIGDGETGYVRRHTPSPMK